MTSYCVRPHEHDKPAFSKNSTLVFYGDRFSSRVPLACNFSRYSPESWLFIACELTLPRAEYLTIIEEGWVYDLKTYGDREGPNKPSEPSLHDSSDHTRAESNGFFTLNSFKRIPKTWSMLSSSLRLSVSREVSGYWTEGIFSLADTL